MIHVYIFTFRLRINNLKVMNIHKVFISFNNLNVRLDILLHYETKNSLIEPIHSKH